MNCIWFLLASRYRSIVSSLFARPCNSSSPARRDGDGKAELRVVRHRLNGYVAQRVPSCFLASSFRHWHLTAKADEAGKYSQESQRGITESKVTRTSLMTRRARRLRWSTRSFRRFEVSGSGSTLQIELLMGTACGSYIHVTYYILHTTNYMLHLICYYITLW